MDSPKFEIGDKVQLLNGTSEKNRKKKLSNQMIGKCKILKKISDLAYELDLPKGMRCIRFSMFHYQNLITKTNLIIEILERERTLN